MAGLLNETVVEREIQETTTKCFEKFKYELLASIKEATEDEELLTRAQVTKRILKCSPNTADKYYLNDPTFPFVHQGEEKRYPKKLVTQWIAQKASRGGMKYFG
ncbi:DNA-binding protein [Listeria booriae]|uniref:DNA-binding protein n=1 Tax=Listeria booriae TaxID=1552123 RepID=A0A842F378_9LIST|nr:DNA-binding protein [Listeria booriae]MBC2241853.1 DNA-binding protein [Listeria booriae]